MNLRREDFEMPLLRALYSLTGGDGNIWFYCDLDSLLPRIEGLLDRQLQRLGIRVLKLVCPCTRAHAVSVSFNALQDGKTGSLSYSSPVLHVETHEYLRCLRRVIWCARFR